MSTDSNPVTRAIEARSLAVIARACGVTHPAVRKWESNGRLPASDHAGSTNYHELIAAACDNVVTSEELLAWSRRGWEATAA